MSDSVKPFACTTEGCNMSFVNEDHLTVHKKKHDMMLNLGTNNKNNLFIADQTPTPTRFIRNCEEVGLFQDLQNENPFEETFRRAVEAGKSGSALAVPEVEEIDDTLHTPNVFPHITEEYTTSVTALSTRNQITKLGVKSFTESSIIIQTTSSKEIATEEVITNKEENKKIIDSTLKENSTTQTTPDSTDNNYTLKSETNLSINGAEVQFLLKTQDGKVLKFVAAPVLETQEDSRNIKIEEQKTKVIANKYIKPDLKITESQKLSLAKMKLKQTLAKNGTITENKVIQNNENEKKPLQLPKEKSKNKIDNLKKQAILERNRASSMRSRAKRKAWIEQLQQSLKVANETNTNLQAQIKNLHVQVTKLKALLLAHKDCPVTKAMEEGNGLIVGSKILTIKPNEIKQIPVVTGPIKSTKRANMEKLIVPKKKPMISTIKNPIILPKADSTSNTITLHSVETIKTIPTISIVAPVVTNLENGKGVIGFVHSDSEKVPLIQDTLLINKNFNENAASKTNGT